MPDRLYDLPYLKYATVAAETAAAASEDKAEKIRKAQQAGAVTSAIPAEYLLVLVIRLSTAQIDYCNLKIAILVGSDGCTAFMLVLPTSTRWIAKAFMITALLSATLLSATSILLMGRDATVGFTKVKGT